MRLMIRTKLEAVMGLAKRAGGWIYSRYQSNWGNTTTGVYLLVQLLICGLVWITVDYYFPERIGWTVTAVIVTAVVFHFGSRLVIWLAGGLIRWLGRHSLQKLFYMVLAVAFTEMIAVRFNIGSEDWVLTLAGVLYGVVLLVFVQSLWAFLRNKKRTVAVYLTGLCSGVLLVLGVLFVTADGFEDAYIEAYLAQKEEVSEKDSAIDNALQESFRSQFELGTYEVASLEYSPTKEAELASTTIDLSFCVRNSDGWKGVIRNLQSDYDVAAAPIAGKVWYPKKLTNCPVLFIVHGNHSITTESYLGYDYLGEYLASYGYAVVTVDENVLNTLSGENDARAILLLENIKKVGQFNRQKDNPLYQKFDYEQIALAGHSRGGETVATAYLFNDYDVYPENAMRKFYYHFAIKSIIAIAPTVDQYKPADHEVELENVNYLLLQGANDQDITENMGAVQYQNITFLEEENEKHYIKSSLYIAGANHGQFNSLWGKYDLPEPFASFLNTENFLAQEDQQKLLKIFAKVFLDATLLEETAYAELLTDYAAYEDSLPRTIYIQQYQRSDERLLCDYEEDSDVETAAVEEIELSAVGFSGWTEELARYSVEDSDDRANYVLHLRWKDSTRASYKLKWQEPTALASYNFLFDICNWKEDAEPLEDAQMTQVVIVLTDEEGRTATIDTTDYASIYPALPVKLGKLQYITGETSYKHEYQTVAVSLADAESTAEPIDLTNIREIALTFPNHKSGNVCLDNFYLQEKLSK